MAEHDASDLACPYGHPKGTAGMLTPRPDGTLRCGKCGHSTKPGDPSYQCDCSRCKAKATKDSLRPR
jgi:hypothetical protein